MTYAARWKTIVVLLISLFGLAYAAPNFVGDQGRQWMRSFLPDWAPKNAVHLGLDLRGGAHLLFAVDAGAMLAERENQLIQDARSALRENSVVYNRIIRSDNGIMLTLDDPAQVQDAMRVMRSLAQEMRVETVKGASGIDIVARISDTEARSIIKDATQKAMVVVRRRVEELGRTDPMIALRGDDRILLQVPGANVEELKNIIGTRAALSLHILGDENDLAGVVRLLPLADDPEQMVAVDRRAIITGEMLQTAEPGVDAQGHPMIHFRLTKEGARFLCDATGDNIGAPMAIVLDDTVISTPVIRQPICGSSIQIYGVFDVQRAHDIALLLRAGALPVALDVVEERTVGSSLGADSIAAGKMSTIIALALVFVFMAVCYSMFGAVTNIALLVNIALMLAILSVLQVTLTLPGIAGIILTIGLAVDANVLIFERIREDLRAGKSPRDAVQAGYRQTRSMIADSSFMMLIATIILYSFGTGPIKGFAMTLGIGIATSFFSVILLTRTMIEIWLRVYKPKDLPV